MIDKDPIGFAIVILAMTLVVYICRASGYWLVGRVTIGPRMRRLMDALPGAIICSTVAPVLVQGGLRAVLAVGAAVLTMALLKRDVYAVAASIIVAAAAYGI
jgi:uncharacterized membrane protein